MSRRGFSLIELAVVVALLLLLFAGLFVVFQAGTRGFYQSVLRVGAVGEAIRLSRAVDHDITFTNFYSVGVCSRQTSLPSGLVQRDGVSLAALTNWSDPANFSTHGMPEWNRHVLYYATDEPQARLFRLEVNPGGTFLAAERYPYLPTSMLNDPAGVHGLSRQTLLLKDVNSFRVETDSARRLVHFRVQIYRRGGKKMLSEASDQEVQDVDITAHPANTYPEL